jgi:hypothetical protein
VERHRKSEAAGSCALAADTAGRSFRRRLNMYRYKAAEKIEDAGAYLLRRIRRAWLSAKFATGAWRGVMINADRKGKLTYECLVAGLHVGEGDQPFCATLGDELVVGIGQGPSES